MLDAVTQDAAMVVVLERGAGGAWGGLAGVRPVGGGEWSGACARVASGGI